jgi:pyruvate formate lyase activating enzyme
MLKKAMWYETLDDRAVKCHLCSHRCHIVDAMRGICGVRENWAGTLYTLVYGKAVAQAVDPIEKKPLYHFLPGSSAYSITTVGCNFRCGNCQNWELSQSSKPHHPIRDRDVPPEAIVEAAGQKRCESIAYTYTEPVIFMEYAYDIAKLAVSDEIKNVFVTNGYITEEAVTTMAPYLHAANIDLKSFDDRFYREHCGARLEPVLETIERHKRRGIWIEVTTLIIPTLNDADEDLRDVAEFIADVGVEIPWHVSRFAPAYQLTDVPSTPIDTLQRARAIGREAGLRYVYQGNVPGEGMNTYCYKCGELLIERYGYRVTKNEIVDGNCPQCGTELDGLWK